MSKFIGDFTSILDKLNKDYNMESKKKIEFKTIPQKSKFKFTDSMNQDKIRTKGIYTIKIKVDNINYIYIGKSNYIHKRLKGHYYSLKTNKHPNRNLQKLFNNNNVNAFDLSIIYTIDNDYIYRTHCDAMESYFYEYYKSLGYKLLNTFPLKNLNTHLYVHKNIDSYNYVISKLIEDLNLTHTNTSITYSGKYREILKFIKISPWDLHSIISTIGDCLNINHSNEVIVTSDKFKRIIYITLNRKEAQ